VLFLLAIFVTAFFRDPFREIPQGEGIVVSPADGKVVMIVPTPAGHAAGEGATQISIFLSVFDVHINRAPIAGTITDVVYNKGEFLPAFDDKASLRNEQNRAFIEGPDGRVGFTQIAGLIARRIVFRKKTGDVVARGEQVGLIRFGSRTDIFLPKGSTLMVKVGDRVSGGSSVIAHLKRPAEAPPS
jgi:phosphatidylserine decarboxylase